MRQTVKPPELLNSWKEIAVYLDRGVRTVQRWEHDLDLPVHRIGKGKRSPVYTTTTELNFWLSTTGVARPERPQYQSVEAPHQNAIPMQDARRLLAIAHAMAEKVAECSVRHRHQAELLQARILEMRSRMNLTAETKPTRPALGARSATASDASEPQAIPLARKLPGQKNAE